MSQSTSEHSKDGSIKSETSSERTDQRREIDLRDIPGEPCTEIDWKTCRVFYGIGENRRYLPMPSDGGNTKAETTGETTERENKENTDAGAVSFHSWASKLLARFGNAVAWLVMWLFVAGFFYYVFFGFYQIGDALGVDPERRGSGMYPTLVYSAIAQKLWEMLYSLRYWISAPVATLMLFFYAYRLLAKLRRWISPRPKTHPP